MIASIETLSYYFGGVGLASVVVWICAVVLMLLFAVRWRRSAVCWSGLALAIVGLALANINSRFVSEIKIDFSQELDEAKQRAAAESPDAEPAVESGISAEAEKARRAEAAPSPPAAPGPKEDDADGANAAPPKEPNSDSPDSEPSSEPPPHDYRASGKVERTEGKQVAEKIPIDSVESDEAIVINVRMMKNHEVMHANRLDRLNLLCARSTLYLAVFLVIIDYFRRFNSTFECYLPLPLGGRLVDSLFRKSHTVSDSEPDRDWKAFLERAVRKGETFILFSPSDLWPDQRLSRLPRFLKRVPWRVEKVTTDDHENRFDDEFLFESAWFGRYCFVVVGEGTSVLRRMDSIVESLELRSATRASARRTLNLVWSLTTSIPLETLNRLLPLCEGTNTKLIVTQSVPDEQLASQFEEAFA